MQRFVLGAAQIMGAVTAIWLYRSDGPTWGFAAIVIGTSVVAASSVARFRTGTWRTVGVALAVCASVASALLAYVRDRTVVPTALTAALDAVVPSDAYALTDVSYDAGHYSVTALRELDTNMGADAYDAWVARRLGDDWRRADATPSTFVRETANDAYSISLEHRDHHVRVFAVARAE